MGYDANIKRSKEERHLRYIILLSMATLALSSFTVISLLMIPPVQQDNTKMASESVKKPTRRVTTETEAVARVKNLDEAVRAIKKTGIIMEADKEALKLTGLLQEYTRELLELRYGETNKNYRVLLELEFQSSIPDFEEKGDQGSILIELAPIELLPCSVFNFLEIARTWKGGAFHRNANHVLQVKAHSGVTQPMPFQEYSEKYPHAKGTVGYAGRPSGPAFYISIRDNSKNHGPGSQQKKNPYEADSVIGTVIQGMDDVVPRIHTMPFDGFDKDRAKWVLIRRMTVLIPGDGLHADKDGYIEYSISPQEITEKEHRITQAQ